MKFRLPKIPQVMIPLIVVFVIMLLIMPRSPKFNYTYRKGSIWNYETLTSQFDFPILKTEEQIQQEKEKAGSSVIPYFRYSEEVVNDHIKSAEGLDLGKYNSLKPSIVAKISDIYSTGIIQDGKFKVDRNATDISEDVLFIQRNKRAVKYPFSEVYKVSDAQNKLLADMSKSYGKFNLDSLFKKSGIYDIIVPNLLFDKQATEQVHAESADFISPTQGFVNSGQLIVSKGEIVTADIAQMLDSYKAEYEKNFGYSGPRILLWLGNGVLAAAILLILYLSIFFTEPDIFKSPNRYRYLLTIFMIATLTALLMEKLRPDLLYVVPFSLIALYLKTFFHRKVTLPVFIVSLLPLLIFTHNGIELFVMYLVAGVVAIYAFKYFNRGWQQFITASFVFLSLVVTYLGFRLIDPINSNIPQTILYLALGSLLSVAGYPVIYLFEKIFNLVSDSRLIDLCDTNNKLLRELAHKAPGTFQHCLQVMSMADAAARAIGAKVLLVRAGALYHDLGKMNNPQCFIENETHTNGTPHYHDGLTPQESAREIIQHVPDGVEIATKAGLPQIIIDFILTHHGTTCTAYFYNKYLNDGGDPSNVSDFFYKGKKPTTREQIILMLCDTMEAASRTLKEYNEKSFSDLVENIFASKMNDGQFDEADISVKELGMLKKVLKDYLSQVYHERIVYPKRKV